MSVKLPRKQIYDVVGEDQINDDGSYRQAILQKCTPGQAVELLRQPKNSYDGNAIFVRLTSNGNGIGYISKLENAELSNAIDAGVIVKARIHELRGGLPDYPNFGCKIAVVAFDKKFRNCIGLRPEQTYYENAPKWRELPTKPKSELKSSAKSTGASIARRLLKGLLK